MWAMGRDGVDGYGDEEDVVGVAALFLIICGKGREVVEAMFEVIGVVLTM